MLEESPVFSSKVYDVPGSSFKIQIEKSKDYGLVRIFRGTSISKEIKIELNDFNRSNIVTIIQSEMFMPISPFKIVKQVEKALNDIDQGRVATDIDVEKTDLDKKRIFDFQEFIASESEECITPPKCWLRNYLKKTVEKRVDPTILRLVLDDKKEENPKINEIISDNETETITPSKCGMKKYSLERS
jgi:hypothetical protein